MESTPGAVGAMLQYVKTGVLPWALLDFIRECDVDSILDLLNLSCQYQLDPLVHHCEVALSGLATVGNATKLLVASNLFGLDARLHEIAFDFIKANLISVVREPNWPLFRNNHPTLLDELMLRLSQG